MTICELVLLWSFLSHPFLRKSEPMKCLFVCMQPRQSVGVKTRGSVGLIFNLTAVHCAAQALLAGRADCKKAAAVEWQLKQSWGWELTEDD